jgi:hypothetical protein
VNRHKTTTISLSLLSSISSSSNLPTSGAEVVAGAPATKDTREPSIRSIQTKQTNLLQTITTLPTNNRPCRQLEISPQLAREALKLIFIDDPKR